MNWWTKDAEEPQAGDWWAADAAEDDARRELPAGVKPNETAGAGRGAAAGKTATQEAALVAADASTKARRGTARGVQPYGAGGEMDRAELRFEPSQAGGGRGMAPGKTAEQEAELVARSSGSQPYRDKREAIDDAVDRIALGVPAQDVFGQFGKLGITQDEIQARGVELGTPGFVPDDRPVTVRDGVSDPKITGTITPIEPSALDGIANFGNRVAARSSQAFTGALATTGVIGPDQAARLLARDEKRLQAAMVGEELQRQLEALGRVKEWGQVGPAIRDNLAGTAVMLAESVAMSAPALMATMLRLPVAVLASGVGVSSGSLEYGSVLSDALREKGATLLDVDKVAALLKDDGFMAEVREKGAKRGLTIGLVDALTAGIAGKFIEPALAAVRAGEVSGRAAVRSVASGAIKELATQVAGGAGGEALAQKLTGENKPLDIALEALAEGVSAPFEARSNILAGQRAAEMGSPAGQLAGALSADIASRDFQPAAISGYAARASDPSFYDPTFVDPRNTVMPPAPKVEEMPTTPFTPEQTAAMAADAAAFKQAKAMADEQQAEVEKAAEQGATAPPAAGQTAATVGIRGVPNGSIAASSEDLLRQNAQGAANEAAAQATTATQPTGNAVPARQAGVTGATAARSPVAAISARYESSRSELTSQAAAVREQAATARRRAAELRTVGLKKEADDAERRAAELERKATSAEISAAQLPQMAEPKDGPALRGFQKVADAFESLTGRKTRAYVDTRDEAGDGFFDPQTGELFVNLHKPSRSVAFTTFHEFQHLVRNMAKKGDAQAQRATQMLDQVWAMIPDAKKRSYAENYLFRASIQAKAMTVEEALADPVLKDEMLSDFMGGKADDATFWQELAKKDPKTFGSFATRWIDMLDKLIKSLLGRVSGGNKDIRLAGEALERSKLVAEKVLREWAAMNPKLAEQQGVEVRDEADPAEQSDDDAEPLASAREGQPKPVYTHEVIDPRNGNKVMGQYQSAAAARRGQDRLDNIYGGYRYKVRQIESGEPRLSLREPTQQANQQATQQTAAPPAEPPGQQTYQTPDEGALKAVGPMAEEAYRPLNYAGDVSDNRSVRVTYSNGRVFSFSVAPNRFSNDGTFSARPAYLVDLGPGAAFGMDGVSRRLAEMWNQRIAASADLFANKFDLFTSIPSQSRKRVIDVWKKVREIGGAAEFNRPNLNFDPAAANVQKLQQIADTMLNGTRYKAVARDARNNWWTVSIEDTKTGDRGSAEIELTAEGTGKPRLTMHTAGFSRGSGMGKPFYQVAFAFGHAIGIRTDADPVGLLGVNNYRRTEQMMSAAVRAGTAGAVNPGIGQRVYGWNERAIDDTQQDRNLVRIALAAARNAVEVAPEARDLTYDIADDTFGWRAGTSHGIDAPRYVATILAAKDSRAVSLSKSTLARAALTFMAIDGQVSFNGVTTAKSPVLYSTRENFDDYDTEGDYDKQAIADEMNEALAAAAAQPPQRLKLTSEMALEEAGIMAESAYRPLRFANDRRGSGSVMVQAPNGTEYSFEYQKDGEGGGFSTLPDFPPGAVGSDMGSGSGAGLSEAAAKANLQRIAASIDLFRRGFDLIDAIPYDAGQRVINAWKTVAENPGAFSFGPTPTELPSLDDRVALLQRMGDNIVGRQYQVNAENGRNRNWITLRMTDRKFGVEQMVEVQVVIAAPTAPVQDNRVILHTGELEAGSGAGKAFYQVSMAFASALNLPVNADSAGLTGINTYRRTEQMLSAALRSGKPNTGKIGAGQRVYGWNPKAKTQNDHDQNLLRLALAGARNAAELAPDAALLRYDTATDKFSWSEEGQQDLPAESYVRKSIATGNNDTRTFGLSRSTLARAAITRAAIEDELQLGEIKTPILYSTREPDEPGGMYADAALRQEIDYKAIAGRRVTYQVIVAETGLVASIELDAAQAARDIDERIDSMLQLWDCVRRGVR